MKTAKFVVFQGKDKWWYWHLVSANGRIIAQGEGHTRKADAERAVKTVMETVKKIKFSTDFHLSFKVIRPEILDAPKIKKAIHRVRREWMQ